MRISEVTRLMTAAAALGAGISALAGSTAFNYQGRLLNAGVPANGSFDIRFALWSAPTGGNNLAFPVIASSVAVSNGLFTASVDFGAVFNGSQAWIQTDVSPAGAGTFTTLSPRQPITTAPQAIFAASAGTAATATTATTAATALSFAGAVLPSQLTGAIPLALLPTGFLTNNATGVSLGGTFTGSGAGLTNLSSSAWSWTGTRTLLLAAAAAGEYQMLNVQYNANLTPTNALVLWPDGTYGVWNATNINPSWFTVDGYTVTYTNNGKTIAQPAVLRDQNGNVTNAPALVVFP